VSAIFAWIDTSDLAAWLFYGLLCVFIAFGLLLQWSECRRERAMPDLKWCPSCGEAMQGNLCQNCADLPLPAFRAHLERMDAAVREASQRAHGHPAGVTLHCEVDTLLRWAGIGSDDRRLW